MSSRIAVDCLRRGAIVCVSGTLSADCAESHDAVRQVLVALARRMGFSTVAVIDDCPRRERARPMHTPAFQSLAASLCDGGAGALFCLDARHFVHCGRSWRRLLDLCALSGTLLVDLEYRYDLRDPSDRRALGLLGSWLDPLLAERAANLATRPRGLARAGALSAEVATASSASPSSLLADASAATRGAAVRRLLVHKFRKLQDIGALTRWAQKSGLQVPVTDAADGATRWEAPTRDSLLRCLVESHSQGHHEGAWSVAALRRSTRSFSSAGPAGMRTPTSLSRSTQ